ncbi:Transposase IS4 family protein [Streptomyces venezuelae]|nr:Transposase IS4 family protein [Streptomyces venezuelae]CUM43909.1 NADH dehydrogenase [Streptomyces venezuelae]
MGRGDLTDEQWAVLEPWLPKGASPGRPPVRPRWQLIDGMRFRVRTGVPWRDMPVEYGPWNRGYDLFRRWQRNSPWHRILTRIQSLADAKGAIVWDLSVNSTVCRADQHAAGARKQGDLQKEPPGGIFTEPVITDWDGRAAGSPPSSTWLSSRARSRLLGSRGGRPAFRPGRLPRASCGRVRDQQPQEASRCRHALRQARRPLRGDRADRSPRRVAVTRSSAPDASGGSFGCRVGFARRWRAG